MSEEMKVSRDVAELEFDRWCAAMKLRFHVDNMDAEDKSSFVKQRDVILDAICEGSLVVSDSGEFVFCPLEAPEERITFRVPRGAHFMEADNVKKGHDVKRGFAVMGAMTGQPASRFSKMANYDLKVCMAIVALFLG